MNFGLSEKEINLMREVFKKFPEAETVFIYGSRAKGNYKKTSDIDLAVRFAKGSVGSIAKMKSILEDLPIIYEIDLADEAEITAGNFKNEYEKTKQIFWKNN